MADVETFDPLQIGQAQRGAQGVAAQYLSRPQTGLTAQGQQCIGLRHLQPLPPLAADAVANLHLVSGLFAQQFGQRGIVDRQIGHDQGRRVMLQIVLREKGLQHFGTILSLHVLRQEGFVAQMAPAAHHRQVQAQRALLFDHGNDVGIGRTPALHKLLLLHGMQGLQLVAQGGGVFVFHLLRRLLHRRAQALFHLIVFAMQQQAGIAHVGRVSLGTDDVHARRAATMDLMQ